MQAAEPALAHPAGPGVGLGGVLAAALTAIVAHPDSIPAPHSSPFGAETATGGDLAFWLAEWGPGAGTDLRVLSAAFAADAAAATELAVALRELDVIEPEVAAAVAPDGGVWIYRGAPVYRWELVSDVETVSKRFDTVA